MIGEPAEGLFCELIVGVVESDEKDGKIRSQTHACEDSVFEFGKGCEWYAKKPPNSILGSNGTGLRHLAINKHSN